MTSQDFLKLDLPDSPGIYFFKGPKNEGTGGIDGKANEKAVEPILYIGRATSLRDRVRSYFSGDLMKTRGQLLVDMVARAESIGWQATDSVLEAIILENNLIKSRWPLYNTKDKDNRSYNYVVITDEDFPQVMLVRGRNLEKETNEINPEEYMVKGSEGMLPIKKKFGPYPQAGLLREALRIVRRIFPFRYIQKGKAPPAYHEEFYRSIGLSPDISSPEAKKEYAKTIRNLTLFFQGRKKDLIKVLEKDMKDYAKARQFERAAAVRNTLYALNHIQDVALIKAGRGELGDGFFSELAEKEAMSEGKDIFRIEAYDIAHLSGKEVVGVMVVVDVYDFGEKSTAENGAEFEPNKNEYRKFKLFRNINDDTGNLQEIITRRLKHPEWKKPNLMVIDGGMGQINAAQDILSMHPEYADIPVVSVVKDKRHKAREIIAGEASDTQTVAKDFSKAILLANAEAHRFAIAYHRLRRRKATGI